MDFEEIKKIIETDGGKFIIIEQGKPTMVITSFEDYKNKLRLKKEPLESMPKELAAEELKLEDLPL